MVAEDAIRPGGVRQAHRSRRRHARPLRRHDRQARGEGARTVQAALARGAGPARERGRDARGPGVHVDADLLRRKPLPAARVPRGAREARGRHHHARPAEVRRAARGPQDRRHGAHVLRALRAALRRLADRHDGLVPRVRGGAELPRPRVALDPAARAVAHRSCARARSSRRDSSRCPIGPGFGVEMDEAAARKAQVPGTPWFEASGGTA